MMPMCPIRFWGTRKIACMSDAIDIAFGWRLPSQNGQNGMEAGRVKAIFACQILQRDETQNRWLVHLDELRSITAAQPIPPEFDERIHALVGRYAFVPFEASQHMTLPMKIETLTGQIRYFHQADPRNEKR